MTSRRIIWFVFGAILLASACSSAKPAVVISSPPSGSEYHEGDAVAIQSTSGDAAGVVRVELTIDGAVVRNDTPPSPQTNFTIIQTWKATAGAHTIIVRAYNAAGATSDPAAIAISVGAVAAATPVPPTTATTGLLSGQVMYTGAMAQPAANAKVVLVDMPTISITAGSDGRYVLSNVPAGAHVVSASTSQGSCNPMNVNVTAGGTVNADLLILTAIPTPTLQAATPCTNNAAFVKDVTIPDGTGLAPGAAFSKSWLVRNSGTCAWTTAYDLAFVSGEAMAATTSIAVPNTQPGETAELIVPMVAPATLGAHTGMWKLRNVGDASFGGGLTVKINVSDPNAPAPAQPPAQPPATGCSGTPNIESFTAAATTINGGQSTTLNWGAVTGADSVEIDNGIGGVPAPGSTTVSPGAKTTYTLIAHCGSNTKTAQVTINVQVLAPPVMALPDLYVSEFSLNPDPPHKSLATQVRVGVYNQGNAASGAFKVQWWAGSNYPSAACSWNVGALPAHGGQILTCNPPANTWGSWYGSITTRVKVDVDGSVSESNEGNNIFDKNISVSP